MGRTKKAFEPLIELLKNNHIEYDQQQTIDKITYNHNKSKQPWLGVLQKFDAKITPLGVSYLQQLANEKLTQSVIDTNRIQRVSIWVACITSIIATVFIVLTFFKDAPKALKKPRKPTQERVQSPKQTTQAQKENRPFQKTMAKDSLKK